MAHLEITKYHARSGLAWLLAGALAASCNTRDSARDSDDQKPTSSATARSDKDEAKQEIKLTPEAIKRYGVRVGPVGKHALIETFVAPARIEFDQRYLSQVTSLVPGRIVDLTGQLGQHVKRGDELAVVESAELGAAQGDFQEKQIASAGAQTAVEPLKQAWERAKALYEKNQGVSLAEVQKREVDYNAAQAAARTAAAQADAARNRLRLLGMDAASIDQHAAGGTIQPRHAVIAPIDGQIVARDVTPGQIVSPDKDTLFTIAEPSKLWVTADVPEPRLAEIAVGANAQISAAGQAASGSVSMIAPSVDAATQTAQVRIDVDNAPPQLKPGMFATVRLSELTAIARAPVLAVPDGAVQMIDGNPFVFVAVDQPSTFVARPIAVGPAVGEWFPVLSGLKEGESIVVTGSFILKAELGKPAED